MAMEIPFDQIKQLQISLRKQVNLSSYDSPNDDDDNVSLPNLPSTEEAIAALDPSPPYLRCKHCKGRLLRGIESFICVFCGTETCKDVPPDPINFRTTIGYRWFLNSFNLDGSEIVEQPVEANNSNRGQTAPKEELKLSDLLDLEITWSSEKEKVETTISNETTVQSKSPLNLAGINIGNFFDKGEKDVFFNVPEQSSAPVKQIVNDESNKGENLNLFENIRPSEESSAPVKQIVNNESIKGHENLNLLENIHPSEESAAPIKQSVNDESIQGHESLHLSENVRPSETAVLSAEGESSYSDSGWGADFHSAASGTNHEESTSYDPFANSTIDLSAQMDNVFGPGKDAIDRKEKQMTASASMGSDWFADGLWSSSNSGLTGQPEEFKITANEKDGQLMGNVNSTSSTSVDWVPDNLWQSSSNKAPDNKTTGVDNEFDAWNDFTSTSSAQNPSSSSWNQSMTAPNDQTTEINLFSSSNNPGDTNFGSFSQPDLFSGTFSSSNGSTEVNKMKLEASALDRKTEANAIDGRNSESVEESGDVSGAKTMSKPDDVEMLMSQMHDLSFMLDSNLSVPSKQDGLNSSSQD
ncbi:uncharacterized protein LOC107417123 [Ziziphus jujuba]|uniref:Uncharacterized protein LOC107417123 n=1 Tax=Ziziphus jujuba TaxID=326968 RepID=A0A6P3ZPW4_ZIZJJ|nr:uncharacterized protein LOC107417123 [Ziziphus jujuba]